MTHQEINDALARSLLDWNRERRAARPADLSRPHPSGGDAPSSPDGTADPAVPTAPRPPA